MRLLTPALIPGIGVVVVLLDLGNLLKQRFVSAFIASLFVIQAGNIAWQIPLWVLQDPGGATWDWGQLRALARAYRLPNPTIFLLGYAREFTQPQIEYPWICHGEAVFCAVV